MNSKSDIFENTKDLDSVLTESPFKGFSKLDLSARLAVLKNLGFLKSEEIEYLKNGGLKDFSLGENFIENVIGYMQIPLGVATNFKIDGEELAIPMAVEETSIVAAASKTAKLVRDQGEITTRSLGRNIIGQIQMAKVANWNFVSEQIEKNKVQLIARANSEVVSSMVARGGGVRDLQVRKIERPDGKTMAVIHVLMDACEAMGANAVNQVCEFLKFPIQELTLEKVTMCILSNLVDTRVSEAKVTLNNFDPELAEKIVEASLFAELDPYRAATNNKGILNGIDPIVIATGNDWRATSAGAHAYAARDGQYRSLSRWRLEGRDLVGVLQAPLVVGTVGGVTALHPTAKISLQLLKNPDALKLSRIMAAVGLVQNLGALKALTTVGIIEGHMKLHIKNLSLGAGAEESEMAVMTERLEALLKNKKRITLSNAIETLNEIRSSHDQLCP